MFIIIVIFKKKRNVLWFLFFPSVASPFIVAFPNLTKQTADFSVFFKHHLGVCSYHLGAFCMFAGTVALR